MIRPKSSATRTCLTALLLGACAASHTMAQTRLEAETLPGKSGVVAPSDEASAQKYVTATKPWGALVVADVPDGDSFSVWARYRSMPLCLKRLPADGGKSVELKWLHATPEAWTWASFGTFTREELGQRILIMRGRGGQETGGIDALMFCPPGGSPDNPKAKIQQDGMTAEDASMDLGHIEQEPDTPVTALVRIDWNDPTKKTNRKQFSLNLNVAANPDYTADPQYAENMAYMNPGHVRYHKHIIPRKHKGGGVSGWLNYDTHTWEKSVIEKAFASYHPQNAEILVTIPEWPDWMDADEDRQLDPDQYDAYAKLCAELVRILNVEMGLGIQDFEISNERDFVYWRRQLKNDEPIEVDELAEIFNRCAAAMKAVDPTIKVGGPTSCRGERNVLPIHEQFARATLPNLDFFSFHCYATGTEGEPDALIYDKAMAMGDMIEDHVQMLAQVSPDREIPVHLNEYNIAWTWKIREPRMRNHKGAVYDSLFLVEAANHGLAVSNAWNECDSVYGKMNEDTYELRPSAHAFHYFNAWLVGQGVSAISDHPRKVVPMAVISDNAHSFVLINRSSATNEMELDFQGWAPADGTVVSFARTDAEGLSTGTLPASQLNQKLKLPPDSVNFYTIQSQQ